jgi:hypothetical protein
VIVPFYVVLGTLSESTKGSDSLLFWRGKGSANNSDFKIPDYEKALLFSPPSRYEGEHRRVFVPWGRPGSFDWTIVQWYKRYYKGH